MKKQDNKAVRDLIRMKIARWMQDSGYESVKSFCRQTKIKLSGETVSRVIEGRGDSMPSPFTLFLIMNKLNVSSVEIKKVLIDAGDDDLHKYVGGHGNDLLPHEEGILSAVRKCLSKDSSTKDDIACGVRTWGKIAGVDLTKEITAIRKM